MAEDQISSRQVLATVYDQYNAIKGQFGVTYIIIIIIYTTDATKQALNMYMHRV